MIANTGGDEAIRRALAALQQDQSPEQAITALRAIGRGEPNFAAAQHLRAIANFRLGNFEQAVELLTDAIRNGERTWSALQNLAQAIGKSALTPDAAQAMLDVIQQVPTEQLPAAAGKLLADMAMGSTSTPTHNRAIFERFALPLLALATTGRKMDFVIALETMIYVRYVKTIETESHFRQAIGQMAPLLTAAGRYWREQLPTLAAPADNAPRRVGFFVHAASTLAHIEVLTNMLKGYRRLDHQPFEAIVYCFSGRDAVMERQFADIGVRTVMLDARFPETANSQWQRLLRLRELIAADGVHELAWVSLVTLMPLAFAMRIAPVQTWWAMKYHALQLEDIDGYVTGGAITRYRTIDGVRWRNGVLGVDDWYDAALEPQAAALRRELGDYVVAGTLAREEKMLDREFLASIVTLLQENPGMFFLWTGRQQNATIQRALEDGGVSSRTRFIGWVNTRLYAQVVDLFLDSFPFPCGFTLFQAMAAGKPAIISTTPEAEETGLWAFLQPLLDGDDGSAEERRELREMIGPDEAPLLSIARSPADFVRLGNRLLADADLRRRAGDASRQLMQRYFSDPCRMGSTYATHFQELLEHRFPVNRAVEPT